ncbi:MAG TPA: hypothetical protein VLA97_05795 [Nocardioidaceae bacterium]|nr:hypothetical protein [Nocardioidaceae bacterium]
MRTPRTSPARLTTRVAVAMLSVLAAVVPAVPAQAGRWAPASGATIHPGVQMYTRGAQCSANFVFTDRRDRVYVGYAAHCAGLGEATDTDGCRSRSLPLGTRVRFAEGGSLLDGGTTVGRGRLAYSSWRTMRRLGTRDGNLCAYNDFALVRVGPASVRKVNPTVPFWGGPVGLHRGGTAAGDEVRSYGSSTLRGGVEALSPKLGTSVGSTGRGWSHPVYTATPGVPGDSGSGYLDDRGRALGALSTLAVAPLAGSNGVGDLRRELRFAQRHSGIAGLRLVHGTRPFRPLG